MLSSRYCDEEGNPQSPSFFLDDVSEPVRRAARAAPLAVGRHLAAGAGADGGGVGARPGAARAAREEPAPGPLTAAPLLELLAERDAVSASALEHFADCPVKWLVDDVLRPEALEPDPEQMVRGSYAHAVLERTYSRLREETGSRASRPRT